MKNTNKQKYVDIGNVFIDKIVALVVELCVDIDSGEFSKGIWETFKGRVETSAKVRKSRSLIEG